MQTLFTTLHFEWLFNDLLSQQVGDFNRYRAFLCPLLIVSLLFHRTFPSNRLANLFFSFSVEGFKRCKPLFHIS